MRAESTDLDIHAQDESFECGESEWTVGWRILRMSVVWQDGGAIDRDKEGAGRTGFRGR